MKKIFTLLTAVVLNISLWAQAPEKMSYQAVIRDASNALVVNTTVGMKISILQGAASGATVYSEIHTPSTNANGLVSLEIGTGSSPVGTFSSINWANGTYFIKTETDPAGGNTYSITATSQLLSVPYALHSKTAESLTTAPPVTKVAFNAGTVPAANQILPCAGNMGELVEMGAGNNYFNDGGAYDLSTNVFTAPFDGVYHLSAYVSYENATPGNPVQLFIRSSTGFVARCVEYVPTSGSGAIHLDATFKTLQSVIFFVEIYCTDGLEVRRYDSAFSGALIYKN